MHRLLILIGLALALAVPGNTQASDFHEIKKLVASDAEADDWFGTSVAVSGDTAVVGAWLEDAGGSGAGAAYVFERNLAGSSNWGEMKKLTASDAQVDDLFGFSVAISGDTIVTGAYLKNDATGAAYVFQRDHGGADNWGEVKKLVASDGGIVDLFGRSVAVSGDTAVIGASLQHAGGSSPGAAYVFQRDQGGADNWGEVKKLTASDPQLAGGFGSSVAVSSNTAVVGSNGQDAGESHAGAAYVFQRDHGGADNWGQVRKLTASDAQTGDIFGETAGISGDILVVGAYDEDAGGPNAGAAYIFQRDLGGADNWGEVTKLTASDALAGDRFGSGIGISGDTIVVGAFREDAGGLDAGTAYVYRRDQGGPGNWGEVHTLTASDTKDNDNFGISAAVSNDTAVVGAYFADAGASDTGAAYVFDLSQPKPTPVDTPTATITPTPTIMPTATATRTPDPVGGIALDANLQALPLETTNSGRTPWGIALAIVAAASLVAAGGTAWYARRRSLA